MNIFRIAKKKRSISVLYLISVKIYTTYNILFQQIKLVVLEPTNLLPQLLSVATLRDERLATRVRRARFR